MSLFASPILEWIGWMLVHSLWLLAIPAALFGALLWLAPQSYCRLRYAAEEPSSPAPFGNLGFVEPSLPWAFAGWIVGVLLMSFRLLART